MVHLRFKPTLAAIAFVSVLLINSAGQFFSPTAQALSPNQLGAFCQLNPDQAAQKRELLQRAIANGDPAAEQQYQALVKQHAQYLKQCRNQNWPQTQAIWLRLYPCDLRPGAMDALMDRLVDQGYNQVYVEVFSDGQVLLPVADNPTVWPSVVWGEGQENADLFALAIEKGQKRGLKVYAWLFTLNYGYSYSQRSDRQQVLARNHQGQTTQEIGEANLKNITGTTATTDQAFIDPYNPIARYDMQVLLAEVLKRNPDGVLFDYVRYKQGIGDKSIVSNVRDMWIYGTASQQAFLQRASNNQGRELMRRFLDKGYISVNDVVTVQGQYPNEKEPLWQGSSPSKAENPSAASLQPGLQRELWRLSVSHAFSGVVFHLLAATEPVQAQGIPAGAVFFPEGNRPLRSGFDSRLQPWHSFPASIEWHPMSYAVCGRADCIVDQVKRVLQLAPSSTKVSPVLAGLWGQDLPNRPSLEKQMVAIRQATPQVNSISHFAFAWQEPELTRARKVCDADFTIAP
ncbi:protein of unknown function DUF187 [Thalassoporum mexicanum PCC 7367]|uniref:family 10 glycosylhydrolase n=1 Tax=Thalassoporum mexicanum TaxID=3457544 RepID=UPI00029FBD6E|nr:family 10 glycosylhydrolase [Pseudanabaena sp. PCC 7367]AFY69940.1 protein of unknown function DUF187 [Pseudanabaena sp. PCC 7367]